MPPGYEHEMSPELILQLQNRIPSSNPYVRSRVLAALCSWKWNLLKGLAKGLAKGDTKGLAKGIAKGIAEGIVKGIIKGIHQGPTGGSLRWTEGWLYPPVSLCVTGGGAPPRPRSAGGDFRAAGGTARGSSGGPPEPDRKAQMVSEPIAETPSRGARREPRPTTVGDLEKGLASRAGRGGAEDGGRRRGGRGGDYRGDGWGRPPAQPAKAAEGGDRRPVRRLACEQAPAGWGRDL
eukprot:gene12974-biopygen13356